MQWSSKIRSLVRGIFRRDIYNIGIVSEPIWRFLDPSLKPDVQWLSPLSNSGAFLADPFVLNCQGKAYLLAEYFNYAEPKGRILCGELTQEGKLVDLKDAMVLRSHASFPFTLFWEGKWYCLPETSRMGELAIYEMGKTPYEWIKRQVIVPEDAVDAAMCEFGGTWWLFYGTKQTGGNTLFIRFADGPFGPWMPHPLNPIKTNPASSRPGGTPFEYEGVLYRPAQDCSQVYGGRIVINKVNTLTREAFDECPVSFVEPDPAGPYPNGLHTLTAFGDRTIIDGKREKFIPAAIMRSLRNGMRRMVGRHSELDL